MKINYQIKDLNTSWVIVKKVSGKDYFYRAANYNAVTSARRAKIFDKLELAEEECKQVNSARKYPFFQVKKASLYFSSDWNIQFNSYQEEVFINNKLVSLRDNLKNENNNPTAIENKKHNVLFQVKKYRENAEKQLEEFDERKIKHINKIEEYKQLELELEKLNLVELVEQNKTESERTAALLYGNKV